MRQIEVEQDLRIRFPNRADEFDDGVEVGIAAALMAVGDPEFSRSVATGNVEQLRAIAENLGYHLLVTSLTEGRSEIVFRSGRQRAKLKLVHSAPSEAIAVQAPRRVAAVLCLSKAIGAPERADQGQSYA